MARIGPVEFDRQELLQKSGLARFANYSYEVVRARRVLRASGPEVARTLVRYREWSRSLKLGVTPIELGVPWMVYESLDFLQDYLRAGDRVLEYGSGGSTIFFAKLGAIGVSV